MFNALGKPVTEFESLDYFDTPEYLQEVHLHCSEFTCRCPVTGQPDFATLDIFYEPGKKCVETKSLKLYLETFREAKMFHEQVSDQICKYLYAYLQPYRMRVTANFNVRGGIAVQAVSEMIQQEV